MPSKQELPISPALAETSGNDSLTELFSRDPLGYQTQDLEKIIKVLREQRMRLSQVEKAKPAKAGKATPIAADDFGL